MNSHLEHSPSWSAKSLKFTLPSPLSLPPEPRSDAGREAAPRTRILIAEDDAVSRALICARLTKWGYEVVATQTGVEAIMALRKPDAPSLAILDWMMPGMDGLEICRRMREVDRHIYIILLTARGTTENLVEGLTAGADDYLTKPFNKDELQARILAGLRVLGMQGAQAERRQALEGARREESEVKMQMGF